MKRDWKKARKEGIQKKFESWCSANNRKPDPDSFIAFDEANGKVFLNHKEAQEKGYYFHLRMQAAAMIQSWATVEILKINAGSSPLPTHSPTLSRGVSVQPYYHLPGKGAVAVNKMDEGERIQLANIFKIEAENKLARAYIIGKRVGKLPETRELMRQMFNEAEEAAYQSVSRK